MFYQNPNDIHKYPGRALRFFAVFAALLGTLALTSPVRGAALPPETVTLELSWDPVPEPNVVGYRVYIGTTSGQYPVIEETGIDPAFVATGLVRGQTYYFAVSAFDDQGVEGPLSEELVVTLETPPLPMATRIKSLGNGWGSVLQWSFPAGALWSGPEIIIQRSSDLINWTEADVVWSGDYASVDGENVNFEWRIPGGEDAMFYRLTARNWLGDSTGP